MSVRASPSSSGAGGMAGRRPRRERWDPEGPCPWTVRARPSAPGRPRRAAHWPPASPPTSLVGAPRTARRGSVGPLDRGSAKKLGMRTSRARERRKSTTTTRPTDAETVPPDGERRRAPFRTLVRGSVQREGRPPVSRGGRSHASSAEQSVEQDQDREQDERRGRKDQRAEPAPPAYLRIVRIAPLLFTCGRAAR